MQVEPLLQNAGPFFEGSSKLTLAEVLTGSFLLRLLSFPKYDLIPKSILTGLESKAPAFYKWTNVVLKEKSVNHIYDEEVVAGGTKARFAKLVAEKSAAK